MHILVDTHVHSVLSGHAYSTVIENAREAERKGLQGFVHADHAPMMPLSLNEWGINIVFTFPEYMENVRVYKGVEANILDFEGSLDIKPETGRRMDFCIASMHDVVIDPGTVEENTCAAVNALKKDYIDVIGHPDRLWAEMDHETIVRETAKLGKIIEINNHSFRDEHAALNCRKIIKLCKKHDVRITVSSDAHIAYNIGTFPKAVPLLEEESFPEELIVNRNIEAFEEYLSSRTYRTL